MLEPQRRDQALGMALLAPTVLLFALLIFYPVAQSLFLSLHRVSTLTLRTQWIGLANFRALFADPAFRISFINTLIWTVSAVSLQLVLGVGVALLLNGRLVGRSAARGLLLFPYLLPTAVAVLVWRWLFNDLYGLINYALMSIGLISAPVPWLSQSPNAMITVILVGTWKFFPFVVIAVLARLQSIPESLYEAARIDGAGRWAQFWDITLPQLAGVLSVVILLRSIWDFKEFDLIYLMTGGGPGISTQTLPILVYRQAFQLLNFGRGAAVAVTMFGFMLLFFAVHVWVTRRREVEA
ncbi:MAG: sugar ABC transporter permease [Acidisphaera sp.]|nr:sugar ABC transporter permease [Acidisphaera sp.]